jgi:ferredoxin--NADP+ reductase
MAKILEKKLVRPPDIFYYKLDTPLIAAKAKPGQFVIIRISKKGERIPLSLPTHIEKVGRVVLVGGGFGVAPLFPIAKASKEGGNEVSAILGARNADLLLYESEMRKVCDEVLITTNDGSKGIKGVVTDALKLKMEQKTVDLIMAIGPPVMMKSVSEASKPYGIKTIVSLNPIMVDGTGMCGGCRVTVGGKTRFACTEGPDFDGHEVDWEVLLNRQKIYMKDEERSFDEWKKRHTTTVCE